MNSRSAATPISLPGASGDPFGGGAWRGPTVDTESLGAYPASLEWFEKSWVLYETIGDRNRMAKSLFQSGLTHHFLGDYQAALVQFDESLKLFEADDDLESAAKALHQAAMMHQNLEAYPKALEIYEKSMEISKKTGDRVGKQKR